MKNVIFTIAISIITTNSTAQLNTFPTNANVGIGTLAPKKILDVRTGVNNFASVGETIAIGQYSGLHFGYSEYTGTSYRKSAVVFEMVDNAARGKIHFLNNEFNNSSSATLSDSKMVLDFNGNLGLGTINPQEKFHIGASTGRINFRLGRWSSFGETFGGYSIILGNNVKASGQNANKMEIIETHSGGGKAIKMQYNEGISFHTFMGNVTAGNEFTGYERMRIDNDGNVGIGTQQITDRLTVNGKIRAEEVRVVVDVPADYVFLPSYKLMSLSEVSEYIKQNRHLPKVPSGEEIKEKGWNVGEMNNKLLEKVEELTLYIIQLEKRIKTLENEAPISR